MLSTLKIRVKILAFWSLFLLSSIFKKFWRLELPNITGKIDQLTWYWKGSTGKESSALKAFDLGLQGVYAPRGSNSNGCGLTFDASDKQLSI